MWWIFYYLKWIAEVIGTLVSYSVDGVGMAVTVLIVFMALDYATGNMSGVINQNLNSRVGFNGIIRKIYYLMLVGSVYLLALVIPGIEYPGDENSHCILCTRIYFYNGKWHKDGLANS
ncbi:phage holin family protein [Lysinibacillus pakistanensis]|uniref:Phage holin family protein n=1 Tax=Lysinibacillus pakistanensis TaxID=759811 RepID=A0AAX3WRF5_9BACI|nr:phage holin family protein [Lysinibacillus pakistanensis]MDM5229764.1 phage holin family protein [Lysinibacillus pakistanensis]WHY45368.1 phage holin family protein [Lysinibacillus pakistanensis]WHY50376.1 phage holin family protein [Lysinibacillus pakistanensis]